MIDYSQFDDAYVAFGKAGLDKNFTLFKVYTRPIRNAETGEEGQYHFDCGYPLTQFEQHVDPVGLLKYLARKYLLHARTSTGVPFEKWIIEFSPIMERYTVPSHLFLDTARDRNWLL